MPIDYSKYPENWKDEIRPAILKRENYHCKRCHIKHKAEGYREKNGMFVECDDFMKGWAEKNNLKIIRIILTIAHLDHDIQNNNYSNLQALCQQCHNRYDAQNRAISRKRNQAAKKKEYDKYMPDQYKFRFL